MSANLIPLQLDQTTGNLVAKAIAGSGTVTSVAVNSANAAITVGGSPVTSNGTITLTANLFTSSLSGVVPASGGGTSAFLRADGIWAVPATAGVTSFNARTGVVTLTSADVNGALGYVAYNGVTNPSGFLTSAVTTATAGPGISVSAPNGAVTFGNTGVLSFNARTGVVTLTSGDVVTALGFTPYNSTNPAGYISANQNITVTGDVSGSGTTAITLTLPTITVAGTYGLVTVNAKGQVTAGSSPTTLAGYGITDGVSSQVSTVLGNAVSLTFAGGGTIHGIPTPVISTDVVNKAYVDAIAQGLTWKAAVKAQTTANLASSYIGTPTFTLTASPSAALPTIDGYAASVGDRILVNNQTSASQNGIYVVTQTTSPWILTRSSDFDSLTPIDEINGAAVYVELGSTYSNTTWTQIDNVTVFDTSPINFTQLSAGGSGTVTSVSVVTANGVSGLVTNPTTTPAITLTLGAITPSSVAAVGSVTGSNLSGTNTGDQTITLTGDVSGSGTSSFATTLATVNANVGSFTSANITVDAKGRITAAASGSGGTGTVTSVAVSGANGIGVAGSPITTNGTISLSLGAITPTSVAATGTIGGSNFSGSSSGTNTGDQTITLTGDVTGSGTGSFAATLATVNGNVGTFGTASNVGTFTVNAKGLITAASSTAIALAGSAITSGTVSGARLPAFTHSGDATGTFDQANPGNVPLTLATVNSNVGSFTSANITVDAKGRITAASNGSGGGGTVTSVSGTVNQIDSTGGANPVLSLDASILAPGSLTTTTFARVGGNTPSAFLYSNSTRDVASTAAPLNGELLVGSTGTDPVKTTLTAGSGIAVTNGAGSITVAANGAMGTGGAGVERVVWRLNAGSTNVFTSATPISITSGVAVSNVVTSTATADYAFTGYDHPPVSIYLYGQQTGTNQWSIQQSVSNVMLDTGTAASPNLISSFTSGNKISAFQTDATATGATDGANTGSYIIVEFKF